METIGEVTQSLFNEVIQTLIKEDLGDVLEKTEKCVEKKEEFILRFVLMLSDSINRLSKDAKICSNGGWSAIDDRWHELNTKVEIWSRRTKLLIPPSEQDFRATLMWMAERGVKEDLGLLRQVEKAPPFRAEDIVRLLEVAEERISERVYSELKNFFNLSQEEFAGIADKTDAVENLLSIKESLRALFDREEIRRWLHTPKATFDGKTPVDIIIRGELDRILGILVRLEEGAHN